MTSAARCWMVLAAVVLVHAVGASAGDAPIKPQQRLDDVQHAVALFSGHPVDSLVAVNPPFAQLTRDYLSAFEPLLRDEAPFSLRDGGWYERKVALQERIGGDMYKWHPLFALTFLEAFIAHREAQLYGRMSSMREEAPADAYGRRVDERAVQLRDAGIPAAEASRRARWEIDRRSTRLHEALAELIERRATGVLADSLLFDPIEARLDVAGRVTNILGALAMNSRFHWIDRRVRQGPGSDELPDAVHDATHVVLTQSDVTGALRQQRFAQVLNLFVLLQNEESRDRLLLLFDTFDRYDVRIGSEAPTYHRLLHDAIVDFVATSFRTDSEAELGLDIVDQMVHWIVERLKLEGGELRHERIADLLLALRDARPSVLKDYIIRFYRDFHALYPAGYETVILHLVGLMLQYAETGVFIVPGPPRPPEDDALAAHEKLMKLLGWTNASMILLRGTLRNVDIEFVDREQREVLDVIVAYLEQEFERVEPVLHLQDPRFIEMLLELLTRVAHLAEPDEITDRVLDPFASLLYLQRRPIGAGIRAEIESLTAAVQRRTWP